MNKLPRGVLGMADFRTRTITIAAPQNVVTNPGELERLTSLGEDCMIVAQVYGGREIRRAMAEIGEENIGLREHPHYGWNNIYAFAGVIGGLEIHGSQMCDGPRYVTVLDKQEEVFGYNCSERLMVDGAIKDPAITLYELGEWERKVSAWVKTAKATLDRAILMAPFWV